MQAPDRGFEWLRLSRPALAAAESLPTTLRAADRGGRIVCYDQTKSGNEKGVAMYFADIAQAKSGLSTLLEKVRNGEDVVIGRAGKPIARIIPYQRDTPPRKGGQLKGKIRTSAGFDMLPKEIANAFAARTQRT
jgi:prevent-host-death family protein